MRKLLFAFLWVLLCATASFAQNTTALAPQALPGLNVQVRGGTILLANSSIGISNTTVALSNNTTNYVFLSSAGVVQTNTTGFTSTVLPIATVLTAQGQIVDIQDNRPDYIFAGGGSGLPAGPTSPNMVTFTYCTTPSGGVAGAATTCWPGQGLTSQTGTSYTFAAADRSTFVTRSNSGTAMTDTIPDAGGTNFAFGYFVCVINTDASAADTISRTSTSQFAVGNGALVNTFVVNPGQTSCFTVDNNNNWRLKDGTISTSEPAAASVSPFLLTGTLFSGGTGTTTIPYAYINQGTGPTTWSTTGTLFGMNASSGFNTPGNFMDFHTNGGTSLFSVRGDGRVTAANGFAAGAGAAVLADQYTSGGGVLIISHTAPTILGAGCGGSGAAIGGAGFSNGNVAFIINVGTAPTSGGCTFTMPAAFTSWNCFGNDLTTVSTSVFVIKQTGAVSTTSVTLQNFSDVAVATAPTASDIWHVTCFPY